MSGVRGSIIVSLLTLLGPGCVGAAPPPSCGNVVIELGEDCDDGTPPWVRDGCVDCRVVEGWTCPIEGGPCAATCGDGITAEGEACDPTDPVWAGFCAADCHAALGVCGDGVVQAWMESCDDGDPSPHDGCTDFCTEALGWDCDASGCRASGVEPRIELGNLTGSELTAVCTWVVRSSGGAGSVHDCPTRTWTVRTVDDCVRSWSPGGDATCTVGDLEIWWSDRASVCDMFESAEPIC